MTTLLVAAGPSGNSALVERLGDTRRPQPVSRRQEPATTGPSWFCVRARWLRVGVTSPPGAAG